MRFLHKFPSIITLNPRLRDKYTSNTVELGFRGETQFINGNRQIGFHHVITTLLLFRVNIIHDAIPFLSFSCSNTLRESEAAHEMVIGETSNLHERIYHRGANATETSSHQVFADDICLWSFHRDLSWIAESVNYWLVVHKTPNVLVKRPKLIYDLAPGKSCKRLVAMIIKAIAIM